MKRYSQPTADAVPVPSLGVQDTMSSVRAGENGLRNAALLAQRGVDSSVGVQDATPTLNAIAQHVTPEQTAAQQTPVIDQHGLNHERNWAFCGIASLVSVLQGEGVEIDGSSREGLNALADQIYTPGAGTSGSNGGIDARQGVRCTVHNQRLSGRSGLVFRRRCGGTHGCRVVIG